MTENNAAPASAAGTMAADTTAAAAAAAAAAVFPAGFLSPPSCALVSSFERGKRRSETARLRTRLR